nr:protein dpy 19 1 [Hymenolepis microstoma]
MVARRRRVIHPTSMNSSLNTPSSSSSTDSLASENTAMPQRPQRAPPRFRRLSRLPVNILVVFFAIIGGLFHCGYVAHLHENHLSFSYLSNTERELTFRSEMAFYYSFYKQIVMANTFWSGVLSLLNDTVTEYPIENEEIKDWNYEKWGVLPKLLSDFKPSNGILVLKRFNLYPELILAGLYRILNSLALLQSDCFHVSIDGRSGVHAHAVPPNQINTNLSSPPHLQPIGTRGRDTVISCEGIREPPLFYVNSVFSLAGLTVFGLVLSGWQVANSGSGGSNGASSLTITIWGAVLPAVGFFFNHGEATRVQWTPPLRESFSYPFFILQQSLLIWLLRDISPIRRQHPRRSFHFICYILLLLSFQLPWQFAQFALFSQLISLMATYALVAMVMVLSSTSRKSATSSTDVVTVIMLTSLSRRLAEILGCQVVALTISWVLQFGNRLLLTSTYLPCLVGCFLAHLIFLFTSCFLFTLIIWLLLQYGLALEFSDGAHIVDLIKVKLLYSAPTFHTLLYTCASAFDYLSIATWIKLCQTVLLPGGILAALLAFRQALLPFRSDFSNSNKSKSSRSSKSNASIPKKSVITTTGKDDDSDITGASVISSKSWSLQEQILLARITPILIADVVSVFVIIQLFAFGLLAALVMRLKLFFTPQLCLSLAILAQSRLFFGSHKILPHIPSNCLKRRRVNGPHQGNYNVWTLSWRKLILLNAAFVGAIALSAHHGIPNLREEFNKKGQFSDFTMETLIHWTSQFPLNELSGRPWVIAGAMPTMAMLRSTLLVPSNLGRETPKFAVTNHPHYENAVIRWRTELVYSVFSRKPPEAVWRIYRDILKADFVVIEREGCLSSRALPGCSMAEIWDRLDPSLSHIQSTLCAPAFSKDPFPSSISRFFAPVFVSVDQDLVYSSICCYSSAESGQPQGRIDVIATWIKLCQTVLLPGGILAALLAFRQALLPFRSDFSNSNKSKSSRSSKSNASIPKKSVITTTGKDDDSDITGASVISSKSWSLQEQILLARITPILIADVVSVFVIIQLFAFGLLAALVMRLKLFFTPQLCLSLAILAQSRLFFGSHKILPHIPSNCLKRRRVNGPHQGNYNVWTLSWRKLILLNAAFVGAIALSAHHGIPNLREEFNKKGQFSDFTMETLIHWTSQFPLNELSGRPWVIAGAMPTMAMLRSTLLVPSNLGRETPKFAVTNHPHYENAVIRWRTELVYSVFSRKPPEAVWRIYRDILKADFVVIEREGCLSSRALPGCSMAEIWDRLDPSLSHIQSTLCAPAFSKDPFPSSISRFFAPVFVSVDQDLVVWRILPG